jgi:predicted nucleotide-binding protein
LRILDGFVMEKYLDILRNKLLEGERLLSESNSFDDLNDWTNNVKPILAKCLGDKNQTYKDFTNIAIFAASGMTRLDYLKQAKSTLKTRIGILKGVIETMEIEVSSEDDNIVSAKTDSVDKRKVFIVHGHDETSKHQLESLLQRVGLEPIILHRKPNRGMAIIEKIEANRDVAFAVVLMTGDDVGRRKLDDPSKDLPRARQNVVLELGYFMGFLGRDKVAVLYERGVEIPSDYNGVAWIELDSHSIWEYKISKELSDAGLNANLSKI